MNDVEHLLFHFVEMLDKQGMIRRRVCLGKLNPVTNVTNYSSLLLFPLTFLATAKPPASAAHSAWGWQLGHVLNHLLWMLWSRNSAKSLCDCLSVCY